MIKNIEFTRLEDRYGIEWLLMDDEQKQKKKKDWFLEDTSKLAMLCDHYGIEPGDGQYFALSLMLAREFLSEKKKRGRKKKWNDTAGALIGGHIKRLTKPIGQFSTEQEARYYLSSQEPIKSYLDQHQGFFGSDQSEAIRYVIKKTDKKLLGIAIKSVKEDFKNNQLEQWDKNFNKYLALLLRN